MTTNIGTKGVRAVILARLFWGSAGNLSASDRVTINIRQSDDAIRRQLLELTLPGTPIEKVYEFLQSRLHRDSPVAGWPPKIPGQQFGDFIYTELGHYFEFSSRSYFMFPTVVQAFWYFDQHNKLREIRVRRFVRGW
jgi:hypothetical protein